MKTKGPGDPTHLERVRELLGKPETLGSLFYHRTASILADPKVAGELQALTEPGSLVDHLGNDVLGRVMSGIPVPGDRREPAAVAAFLDRLAHALSLALTNVEAAAPIHSETFAGGRFTWLTREAATTGGATHAERLAARLGNDTERLRASVFNGLVDAERLPSLRDTFIARAGLSKESAGKLSTRAKDLNAVLFSSVCLDLAQKTRSLAQDPAALASPPLNDIRVRQDDVKRGVASFVDRAVSDLPVDGMVKAPSMLCLGNAFGDDLPGPIVSRVPVGTWPGGEAKRLSAALARSAQLVMAKCDELGGAFDTPAHREALGGTTFQSNGVIAMKEGVMTTAQSIALLLAHQPQGMSIDQALEALQRSPLVTTLAAAAPFGVVQPLAATGLLPAEPMEMADNGRLVLPPSLSALIREVHASRELPSRDATSDYAKSIMSGRATNRTETKRGCPVAGRSIVMNANGVAELSASTPLQELVSSFIDVTRALLRGPPVRIEQLVDSGRFR